MTTDACRGRGESVEGWTGVPWILFDLFHTVEHFL